MDINYASKVLSLPYECVMNALKSANADQLRVIIYACSNEQFIAEPHKNRARAVKDLQMQWSDIESALDFWRDKGAFIDSDREADKAHTVKRSSSADLLKKDAPEYTGKEAAEIIEKNITLQRLIDKCGAMLGKMLNKNEVSHIVSMYDYLQLSSEYIQVLFEYCIENDKKSVVYISRMAFSMFDSDVTTVEGLKLMLEEERKKNDLLYRIKELFGIGARTLTTREKSCINKWIDEYKTPFELITEAYEITVDKTGDASVVYANAILKRWFEAGYTTLEQTKAEAESYKASKKAKEQKNQNNAKMGNFDEEEFLDLALKRSYKGKNN